MGIGVQALYLLKLMKEGGYIKNGSSIIELGSQQFAPDLPSARDAIQAYFPELEPLQVHIPENLYYLLGIKNYVCIDLDGANNALVFNLNKPIDIEYKYKRQFDFVSNHGTTEHAFDQFECFNNVHKLTKVGGIMLHALPSQGYQNHSFFNYHPSFFMDLASANGYEIHGLFYNVDEELFPYYDNCLEERGFSATDNIAVFAVLKKVNNNSFVVPFDGRYYFDQNGDDFAPRSDVGSHYRVEHNVFPLSKQEYDWSSASADIGAKVKIVTPVWGKDFAKEFVTFNLHHQVYSELLKFDRKSNIEYIIVTDHIAMSVIQSSEEYKLLRKLVNVTFLMNNHLNHLNPYLRLTESYNLALKSAKYEDLYIFTTSDCFFSQEVFQKVVEKAETARVILSPALRVLQEAFIAEVNISGECAIDGRKALGMAMRTEHKMTEAFCINNTSNAIHPLPAQALYKTSNGYVGRWTVMHPLAVRISNISSPVMQTIDFTYALLHTRDWSDVAILDSIDDGLTVSLTPQSYDQGEPIRYTGSKKNFLRNMKEWVTIPWATDFHLAQVSHPVRLVMSETDSENIAEIEQGEKEIASLMEKFFTYVNSRRMNAVGDTTQLTTRQMLQPALDNYDSRYKINRLLRQSNRRLREKIGRYLISKLRIG